MHAYSGAPRSAFRRRCSPMFGWLNAERRLARHAIHCGGKLRPSVAHPGVPAWRALGTQFGVMCGRQRRSTGRGRQPGLYNRIKWTAVLNLRQTARRRAKPGRDSRTSLLCTSRRHQHTGTIICRLFMVREIARTSEVARHGWAT